MVWKITFLEADIAKNYGVSALGPPARKKDESPSIFTWFKIQDLLKWATNRQSLSKIYRQFCFDGMTLKNDLNDSHIKPV